MEVRCEEVLLKETLLECVRIFTKAGRSSVYILMSEQQREGLVLKR